MSEETPSGRSTSETPGDDTTDAAGPPTASVPPRPGQAPRPRRRLPDLDTVYSINADGSRNFIHPADVRGRWQIRKDVIYFLLIILYVALPWVQIGGHPAMHFDIPGRNAYLFGATFTNQDFYLMFFLLTGMGFALFVATSLWGRVWCGYACPQTVWLEGVYRKIERWIEGPRERRIRRNMGPLTFDKGWRKGLKHAIFLVLSFLLAHVFLAYFLPLRELAGAVRSDPGAHWSAFLWGVIMTAFLYFDYAWFREQLCLVICPYGRIQSALIDADTVIIGYDEKRGEPRSKISENGGACVDCFRCVAVCPTGIDIRNGLQMECIGCANCIDACDEIMDKTGQPRGLVRYDSQRGFEGKRRSFFRPRFFVYVVMGLAGLTVATLTMAKRSDFEARVLRSRGLPYQREETRIRNTFTIRIQNKSEDRRTYWIAVGSTPGMEEYQPEFILPQSTVRLQSLADFEVPVLAYVDRDRYEESFPMTFTVTDSTTGKVVDVDVRFRGP